MNKVESTIYLVVAGHAQRMVYLQPHRTNYQVAHGPEHNGSCG